MSAPHALALRRRFAKPALSVGREAAGVEGLGVTGSQPSALIVARSAESKRALAFVAAVLLACSGAARRLDDANAARRAGRPADALAGYQEVLAELGDGRLPERQAALRLKALRGAGDVAYLELGDFTQAVSYYRRIVALYPGGEDAWKARALTGDIYLQRFGDPMGAIAQWADIAQGDSPDAPAYQLKVASAYLDLRNFAQARTEARVLRERWPASDLADEGQLLTAQAWALEKRPDEAQRAFQALLDRRARPELRARALEGQAGLAAEAGKFDRALALYEQALEGHPSPDTLRLAIAKVKARRERARPSAPGDRATAFYDARARRIAGHASQTSAPTRRAEAAQRAPGGPSKPERSDEAQESSAEPSGETAPAPPEETP